METAAAPNISSVACSLGDTARSLVMEKRFDPSSYEQKWQREWQKAKLFECPETSDKPSFSIMIPPPNVTGKLHMGHALQSALQDLIVRRKRMQGFNALWLPGTDHAGIATQLMVERQVESEGTSRLEMGRETFLNRTWEWKEQYQSNIRSQLELLGASCDWSRERFTLDEGLSEAVRRAFVDLHRDGLVYRGEYVVNWSPKLRTAVSDLEVESKEVKSSLWHFRYPFADSEGGIVVATTRPETMLGDTAVAVHPDDDRYRDAVGKQLRLPIVGRLIKVVADEHVDPEFGSGAVKITPFHDPNDFELAKRHDLEGIRVIGFDGRMTEQAGPDFEGLDRFEARKKVVERLDGLGCLVKIEDHVHAVGHSQRSGEPVEPMVSSQWFVNVESMARSALEAVDDGRLELVPESWVKTWEHWLENVRPWVVSRQLWWGHRIPAWYREDGEFFVAMNKEEAAQMAGTEELTQDPDVLDTWFSSGLWPFSTLGWPDPDAKDVNTFYPTDVLITGFDILFFWVARMTMMGLYFTGESPFKQVHLTGLVRDEHGEKMSKTKGNVIDPLVMVEEYGADAMRFTLCALDAPGRDIPLNPQVMAGYRAFGNKIWNATRFILSRIESDENHPKVPTEIDPSGLEEPERWLLSRFSYTAGYVNDRLDRFRFDEACQRLYDFFWKELCDWSIEFAKPSFNGEAVRPQVAEVLLYTLDQSLRLLHPVMPHLTEELWQKLPRGSGDGAPNFVAIAAYPDPPEGWRDQALEGQIDALQEAIGFVRSFRKERNVARDVAVSLFVEGGEHQDFAVAREAQIRFLTQVEQVVAEQGPDDCLRDRVAGLDLAIHAEIPLRTDADRARLDKELEGIEAEIKGAQQRLSNPGFLERAPEKVVEGSRARLAELEQRRALIQAELA